MPSDFITFIILARDSSFIFNTIFVKTTFSSNNGKIQLVLSARHKLDITIALHRAGAVVCAAVWRAALLPQHLPAAGQACHHQLHPAEVRRGPGLLRGVWGTAHQDQQDLQDIQVSQPCNSEFWHWWCIICIIFGETGLLVPYPDWKHLLVLAGILSSEYCVYRCRLMLKLKNSNNIAATTLRDSCDRMAAKSAARPNFVSPRYSCALPPDYLLLLRNMLHLLHVTNIAHDTSHM